MTAVEFGTVVRPRLIRHDTAARVLRELADELRHPVHPDHPLLIAVRLESIAAGLDPAGA